MAHVIVEEQFDSLPNEQEMEQMARRLDAELQKRGAKWKRTYLAEDINREVCEIDAPDVESVKQAFTDAGLPMERAYEAKVSSEKNLEWH